MKFKLTFEYDGSCFYGYQLQKDDLTVQGEIERVLKQILQEDVRIYSSGRTDRGVHARNQVCHFESDKENIDYVRALNSLLCEGIYIKNCEKVNEDFHSRFSAVKKQYQYVMMKNYNVFDRKYKTYISESLDLELVKEVMRVFLGTHDFRNFSTSEDEKDTVRDIYSFDFVETNEDYIFTIEGNGFLRYMVRMIMGTVIEYGKGRISLDEVKGMLDQPEDKVAKFKAAPEGLYLNHVYY